MIPRSRRQFLHTTLASAGALALNVPGAPAATTRKTKFGLATFSAEITPPLGHALMGGGITPAREVSDPLWARGLVLFSEARPLVILSVDWCEIRNEAFERWRKALAQAAKTDESRVILSSVHVHDAPIADLAAQRLLERQQAAGSICQLDFHEAAVQRVARALRESKRRPISQVGLGQAKVNDVASNRRYLLPDGRPTFGRTSSTRDAAAHAAPEGNIDPWLKTLSLWNEDEPVAALHVYATHPMSYYGRGMVSSDFVGLARQRRQNDQPGVFQIYASGCSGNVTAGKYNDGSAENRPALAERIYRAMQGAWEMTRRYPLSSVGFRNIALELEPRSGSGFSAEDLRQRLATDSKPFGQCLAAMGLSWRQRLEKKKSIDLPAIDFGPAQLLLLPAESYVEYQLYAQAQRPESFVVTLGYGECAPGYIPIEQAWAEKDSNLNDWCWVEPGSEARMKQAIQKALARPESTGR